MKNYVIKMVTAATMVLLPLAMAAVNSIIHTATYDFSGMTTSVDLLGGVAYKVVSYPGLFNGGEPGAPSLPIDYIRLSVPYNATNFTVNAVLRDNVIMNIGNELVYPSQPPRMMSDTSAWTITLPDSSIYYSNAYYPASNAWVASEGFLAGENHIVTVAVAPVSYRHNVVGNTASNQLRQSRTVRLTLSYELSDTLAMYPIVRQNDALRQEGYALTRSMVANPQNVESFAPVDIAMDSLIFINPNGGDGINSNIAPPDSSNVNPDPGSNYGGDLQLMQYPYLIVTTPELKHSLRRIAALKRQKGYNVKIVTMDEVTNDPYACQGDLVKNSEGNYEVAYDDDAGKLRQFLKHYFQRYGTKYVLLAGTDVPYYYHEQIKATGDMYYEDLNSDWRGIFDRKPELFVGRLLGKTPSQISNYTDKLIRYELNPGNGNYSYLKKALFSESKDFIGHLQPIINSSRMVFTDQTLIQEKIDGHFPKACDIIDSIGTNHYSFWFSYHHGEPSAIKVYGVDTCRHHYFLWAIDSVKVFPGIIDSLETNNGLNCIKNRDYPMICYSLSCSTMPYNKKKGYDIDINFGESFTMGKDYGGPLYMGNTIRIYPDQAEELAALFSNYINNGYYTLGEADALSKSDYCGSDPYGISVLHNLLGDPKLELWTDSPQQFSDISLTRTDNSITVSGINGIDSTIVAYLVNGEVPIYRYNSSTVTFNNVSPNGTIMLYKHNYIPYISTLTLQNITLQHSQYVIATDVIAGCSVDTNRSSGNVIINSGVQYEIEATGDVRLEDGFNVEKGATFAIYPSCF